MLEKSQWHDTEVDHCRNQPLLPVCWGTNCPSRPYFLTCLPKMPVIDFDWPLLAASTWTSNQNAFHVNYLRTASYLHSYSVSLNSPCHWSSIIELMLFLSTRLIISSTAYSVFKEAPNPSFIRTKHGTIQTLAPERLLTQQNESEM